MKDEPKPRRLGRGLEFLLSGTEPAKEKVADAGGSSGPRTDVEIASVVQNPWQPRSAPSDASIDELAASIQQVGLLQPIVVRKGTGGKLELVAGERRLLAAKKAGLTRVPAIVKDVPDDEMLLVALVENTQRQDLNPIDRARAFQTLADRYKLSHEAIAKATGQSRSTVSNTLRLLDLDRETLAAAESGTISEGHARALLAIDDAGLRQRLLKRAVAGDVSVREIESHATQKKPVGRPRATGSDPHRRLAEFASEKLGAPVRIVAHSKSGRIEVRFKDLAEFDRLFEAIVGERVPDDLTS